MAGSAGRAESSIRLIKLVSLVVCLVFLTDTVSSLDFGANLDMYKAAFREMLDQAVGYQKQRQNRVDTISRLLTEAQSLTNEKQLERFMKNLQKAVNEAYEQKTEGKYRISAGVQQLDLKLLELYPKIQQLRKLSTGDDPVIRISEKLIQSVRTYFTLKKKVISPEAKDMGKSLKEVLNVLKKSHQHQHQHEEL